MRGPGDDTSGVKSRDTVYGGTGYDAVNHVCLLDVFICADVLARTCDWLRDELLSLKDIIP